MEKEASTGEGLYVGLFHSGTGEVHLARVDRVVVPVEDEYGQFLPVGVPDGEDEHVPAYYRRSPHSRGWLRVASISGGAIDFFGKYSYADPLTVEDSYVAALGRLVGKRIMEADELRGMDATIWAIRESATNDSSERLLIATIDHDGPLSARPVECSGEWLLHVSDPHYALGSFRREHGWRLETESSFQRPAMVDAINDTLLRDERKVGAVLVTGDLTYVGSEVEYNEARLGLFRLVSGLLGLGTERLVVVPGNHDIVWTRSESYEHGAPVDLAPVEATRNYREFYRSLFGFDASDHLSMTRRLVFPGGRLVDILGVNSSSLEQGKSFLAGMGRVQEAAYREASTALSWGSSRPLGLRILALHHHLALTEDLESSGEYSTGFGIAIDSPRIQRMAAADGVHLALHGHKHRAFVWRANAYHLPEYAREDWELGAFNIVGAGSAGSTATDGGRNFFNLLRVSGSAIELEMYASHNGGTFERFSTWRSELTVDSGKGGLRIEPWKYWRSSGG